jgi:deoxyribose-phosphate aldolase
LSIPGGQDVDRLVDLIAHRVERELTRRAETASREARCGDCKARSHCDAPRVIGSVNAGAARIGSTVQAEGAPPCAHVAPLIDHTLLKPEATRDEVAKLCEEARRYNFATVCVNSAHVRFAAACLQGSSVKPIAVVGFPLGAGTSGAKAFETREAIRNGAQEIDMVINIGALKARDHVLVFEDIKAVVDAAQRVPVKVILETSKLDDEEKLMACAMSKAAGAAFVKTSTGFGGGGATPEDIALMRRAVGSDMGVKASGGIRSIDDVEKVIEAGASRIGASASVAIVQCVRPSKGAKGY